MDAKPCAVIASCTELHPEEIIKLILGADDLPEASPVEEGIKAYPWHIDTKYYTADIDLCAVEKKTIGSEQFAASVEALVINFDSNKNDSLEIVDSWMAFLKEFEPEVQILLCDRCYENPETGVGRVKVQEWCVERGFELVELNPELDPEWEEEQDFIETTGIKRVIQAMHAHLWPNLHMKGKPHSLSKSVQSMLNGGVVEDSNKVEAAMLSQELQDIHLEPIDNNHKKTMEERIDDLLGDSGCVAGFSSLFEQLNSMKQQVQGLPSEQRKACAEQVVMAFWRAINSDDEDDELGGLNTPGET